MKKIRHKRWAIAEGYTPNYSTGPSPEMQSHETACVLNANDEDAHLTSTIYFSDRNPIGPYKVDVAARRTKHVQFNDLKNIKPIPAGTDYACIIESNVPIVVQHTRLDSRQAENALLSTMAFPAG